VADLRPKLMKILRAELEDLLEDIGVAERRHANRFACREVTDYVFKQNDALFHAEIRALRRIIEYLDCLDVMRYSDLDSLVKAVDTQVREAVKDHDEPEAAYRFVARKLEKVRRYVEDCP